MIEKREKLPRQSQPFKEDWRSDVHRMMGDIDLMQYHTAAMKFQGRGAILNDVRQHLVEMNRHVQQVREAIERIEKSLGFVSTAATNSLTVTVATATDSPVRCTSCNERVGIKRGDYTVMEEDVLCSECFERIDG